MLINRSISPLAALLLAYYTAAQRPLAVAPVQLSNDERQCAATPGGCSSVENDAVSYAVEEDDEEYGDDDGADYRNSNHLPYANFPEHKFLRYVADVQSKAPSPSSMDLIDSISDRLASHHLMYRHMERAIVYKSFPTALEYTLSHVGNYSDGTKAGSPQWAGDVGAQDSTSPTYASFGSVLDVSNDDGAAAQRSSSLSSRSSSRTVDTIPWLASLIWREEFITSLERTDEQDARPCRTDLLDDYDHDYDDVCFIGAKVKDYVSVRPTEDARRKEMVTAASFGIADRGEFLAAGSETSWPMLPEDFLDGRKFDTVIADGVLSAAAAGWDSDDDESSGKLAMHDMDLVVERLVSFLKPGGTLILIGKEPLEPVEDAPGNVYQAIVGLLDAVKILSGELPRHDMPASWVHRMVSRLGLDVFRSTTFTSRHSADEMFAKVEETKEWIDHLPSDGIKKGMYKTLKNLFGGLDEALGDVEEGDEEEPQWVGGYNYIIAAELPSSAERSSRLPLADGPSNYKAKPMYDKDYNPAIEELDTTPVPRGELREYMWANGDEYDGVSARIGVPPHLVAELTDYVKKLGIWDLMITTINNDPMPLNTTRFFTVKSPFGEGGREFTWSAKRPDNFYGSDSDMHWFDIADEAAHEDSLRALARGGFDEVLNAIGKHLGLDHLVTFSIGLLAVTKADNGYVHIDFTNSDKRAFNFLINLQTPSDDPELTVIEEDDLGNRRRGQVKYTPDFGVLNGDDAMHATNECNHRARGGVRITASIFIAELTQESLEQVAEHDKYYFPFGNMDWIWAQRGRHWNKEGTVSLVDDKGREPFEAFDEMDDCEGRVGENKEKCLMHGPERMLCYKTCGMFLTDDVFRPGEERQKVLRW